MDAFVDRLGIERYSLYLMDYGAPIGFRLAAKHPERVASLIVQNGNAYIEGLREFWDPIRTLHQICLYRERQECTSYTEEEFQALLPV